MAVPLPETRPPSSELVSRLLARCERRKDALLDAIGALVAIESPSRDREALARVRAHVQGRLRAIGVASEEEPASGGALGFELALGADPLAAPVLAISHLDTVWPLGTLARRPFRVAAGEAFGPGIFDTKAGVALLVLALEALQEEGVSAPRPIKGFLSLDEEVGSPGSKRRVIELARRARAALVLEPALGPNGAVKTQRKGVGRFKVTAVGRAAHAGLDPDSGASAIHELALQVTRIAALADRSRGTTLNVGRIEGGTTANVIAARAAADVDARVFDPEEADRVERALRSLEPSIAGTKVEVEGGFDRPPLLRSPAVVACYELARGIARDLGFELEEGSVGGGSDGCHTAPLVATLDGLGAVGAGAHADDERISVDWLARRAALLAALLVSFA
jgi:glutamate carboxypeptidase